MQRLEQRWVLGRGGEHLLGEASIQVQQVGADARLELVGEGDAVEAGGTRQGSRSRVEPVEAELAAYCGERVDGDPAIRRQLASRHGEHPRPTAREDRLAARADGRAVPAGQNAESDERRTDPVA